MEIERKWMVTGWPEGLPLIREQKMRQGYLSLHPTVRIREEALSGGDTHYILCFKTGKGIVRRETEIEIHRDQFLELEEMIALPLIPKIRRTYAMPDGLKLEVNRVDRGTDTEFWYAEIEYPTEAAARAWQAPQDLSAYLSDDVSERAGYSMGAYWMLTRKKKGRSRA